MGLIDKRTLLVWLLRALVMLVAFVPPVRRRWERKMTERTPTLHKQG